MTWSHKYSGKIILTIRATKAPAENHILDKSMVVASIIAAMIIMANQINTI
jgi:hypothetical protein